MPLYTIKNIDTKEEHEINCTYVQLQEILDADNKLIQKLTTPGFISTRHGTLRTAGSGWKDLLGKIKSSSGKQNTINT